MKIVATATISEPEIRMCSTEIRRRLALSPGPLRRYPDFLANSLRKIIRKHFACVARDACVAFGWKPRVRARERRISGLN